MPHGVSNWTHRICGHTANGQNYGGSVTSTKRPSRIGTKPSVWHQRNKTKGIARFSSPPPPPPPPPPDKGVSSNATVSFFCFPPSFLFFPLFVQGWVHLNQ